MKAGFCPLFCYLLPDSEMVSHRPLEARLEVRVLLGQRSWFSAKLRGGPADALWRGIQVGQKFNAADAVKKERDQSMIEHKIFRPDSFYFGTKSAVAIFLMLVFCRVIFDAYKKLDYPVAAICGCLAFTLLAFLLFMVLYIAPIRINGDQISGPRWRMGLSRIEIPISEVEVKERNFFFTQLMFIEHRKTGNKIMIKPLLFKESTLQKIKNYFKPAL